MANAIGKGIDCCSPITSASVAAEIAAVGYAFVGRYLVPHGYSKRLTASEAQILTDAGLLILCVYETSANRPKGGAETGRIDGRKALAAAQEIGMPTSAYIYFAVDYGAGAEDYDKIEAYLRAAKEQIGDYGIGVYGSFYVVEAMAARGICDGYWQCVAWSNKQVSEHAGAYQYAWDKRLVGIGVDFNYLYSSDGLWNLEDDIVRYERLSDIPNEYGFQNIVGKLMDAQIINGDGSDTAGNNDVIDLSHDQVRSLVFEYRGGAFDRKLMAMGFPPAVQT